MAAFIFWTALGLVFWSYAGYPILLLLAKIFAKPGRTTDATPSATLIISAFNEEAEIAEKLGNSLAIDYPSLEIMVISDASSDQTDEIVQGYSQQGVRLYRQENREGKSAGLSRFVPQANGEIIVFSDANSMYEADAIRKLVRHFADAHVGYVVGHQKYIDANTETARSESLYWKYETWLKQLESDVGGVVGGDGAIMAIRAELFEPLRPDDINDFYLPLRIVARGFRGVFETSAICYERTAANFQGEFRRKIRIVNRSARAVYRAAAALNPLRVGFSAVQLMSHKVLRWLAPFFLLLALAANVALALEGIALYRALLVGHLSFYALAALRIVPGLGQMKIVYVCFYFCLINLAAACGILSFIGGKKFATWAPQR